MKNLLPHARLAVLPGNHGSYLGEAASTGPGTKAPDATAMLVEEFLAAH